MNNDEGQILPELSKRRLDFLAEFFLIFSIVLSTCYYVSFGAGLSCGTSRAVPFSSLSSRKKTLRVVENVVLIVLFGGGLTLCRRNVRNKSVENNDLLWSLFGYVLFGVAVEIVLRRYRNMNDVENGPAYNAAWFPWRLILFLLVVGSYCLQESYVERLRLSKQNYEYLGPMRITKMPTTHKMNRIYEEEYLELWPCLKEKHWSDPPLYLKPMEQDWIEVTVELGWGKSWGCRNKIDKWNTNWPSWKPCASLICADSWSELTKCPCHPNEAEARNASMQCMENTFDLSRFENDTGNASEPLLLFDEDTPPWEDPGWPSVVRYGSCDGNVGLSAEVGFVDEKKARANVLRNFGYGCFLTCAVAFVVVRVSRSRNDDRTNPKRSGGRTL